ncbi:hypothetical protein Nepgr_008881 [Nepenthes gracilis]|uniref:Uncharacterized protein n=1 Tax=Nepenthes gracilis TaxID=150966 RepID=A0AAD3SAE1_NEPGR|nr:hypothetical protein Nepgr_008881 [Nepenthes gracilis]
MAGVEAENADLKAEVAELKAEVARLKEEDDRLRAGNKRLADRAAASENELASRMTPLEVGGALHARLLEGLNIGRRVARLITPDFPVEFINQRNRVAQCKEDLVGEPRDSQGGPPDL